MANRRRATFLFVFMMCAVMSVVMSLAMTIVNRGFPPEFFRIWLRSASIGFMVALPTALLVVPPIRRLAEWIAR